MQKDLKGSEVTDPSCSGEPEKMWLYTWSLYMLQTIATQIAETHSVGSSPDGYTRSPLKDLRSVPSAVPCQGFMRTAVSKNICHNEESFVFYIDLLPTDSCFTVSSLTERGRGRSDRWQEEAHPGLNPKPTLQRLSSLRWAIWGKNFRESNHLCCWEFVLGNSDPSQPCAEHGVSEKLNIPQWWRDPHYFLLSKFTLQDRIIL